MSGFAVIVDVEATNRPQDEDLRNVLQFTVDYKALEKPALYAAGKGCLGAKLDSAASLHRGITDDVETGSWLIAAGTVIDTAHIAPDGALLHLLKDYVARGPGVLQRCDGLFALVIYDQPAQKLSVISDPFAYFSVFYAQVRGRMFISTSALAVAKAVQAQPDPVGVECFLRTGKVFGNQTLWREVKRLAPGTRLEFDGAALHESTYWRPAVDDSLARLSFEEALDISMEVIPRIAKQNLEREGKVWIDLTGGFDTRFMALWLEQAGIPFKANCVGSPDHPDVRIATTIAEAMRWDYENFDVSASWPDECPVYLEDSLGAGDGHLDVLVLSQTLWSHRQKTGQYSTLLSGLGGEVWRGPLWWPERGRLGQSTALNYDRQLWSLMHPVAESVFNASRKEAVEEEIRAQFKRIGQRYAGQPNAVKLDGIWAYRETAHVGAFASAAAPAIRVICPLFFKDAFTHVISLDYRWKVRNELVKHLLERCSPVLANIDVDGRGPAIPRRLTNYHRFIPSKIAYYRQGLNKLGQIALGRSLWVAENHTSYSRLAWRREILKFAAAQRLFEPAVMRSAGLYNLDNLYAFLARAHAETFGQDNFLGRMITVEMALRSVGAHYQ